MIELALGSNTFRKTNGVLTLQGKEQLVLEYRPEANLLFLTMDLYDAEGRHIAHLRRNAWAFNAGDRFAFTASPDSPSMFTDPPSLRLVDGETGTVVLEARAMDQEKISVPQGRFYTHKGHLFEITSHLCRLAGIITLFGEVRDVRGGAIVLG